MADQKRRTPAKTPKKGSKARSGSKVEAGVDPNDPVLPAVNRVVDHGTPKESLPFPIVAIGASAGGLEAFTAILKALPNDTGMAFVIVQHLSPTYESVLSEILNRATAMPVVTVADSMRVEPNHVYVIPPGKNLVFSESRLWLVPRTEGRLQQRPIDNFMRSLAEEHGHKSIGVVLSGTANDGSLGIQEIKAAGGITFAQDSSAEQQSMPQNAIATGAVDFVLSPAKIGSELGEIARHPYVSPAIDEGILVDNAALEQIFEVLRQTSGVDFAGYKRNTLNRRIARRLLVHKMKHLEEYVPYLQSSSAEADALFQDVLINVTSFFRNPEAYEALKSTVFPRLLRDRSRREPIRMWALGCSTGEEAYSLAIAFTEYREQTGVPADAQIFATDLNGLGIDKARAGLYSKGILQDVAPERLRRFFVEVDGNYRVAKPIRDMCVFARQNIFSDPPFSRLDLVACRNLLIYLEPNSQRRLIPMLHYALRNHGFLWLGASETIGSYREFFEPVDTKHKIYAKKAAPIQPFAPAIGYRWEPRRQTLEAVPQHRESPTADSQREADRMLISLYAPPAVILSEDLEILHFRGDTSAYLAPPTGRATFSFLKMLREGLLVGVRGALQRARKDNEPARVDALRVRSNGGWREVDVSVLPIKGRGTGNSASFIVAFEEPSTNVAARTRQLHDEALDASARSSSEEPTSDDDSARIKQELAATRDYLQSVIEQQEAANEELQSANEEIQSANEELQSINEELETSKEEIQSANEELATVNDELQDRNAELSQSNNDLTNLLGSVQLAIIMLGPDLRIRRFTPAAEKLCNLIPSDVGRALTDINLNIAVDGLESLLSSVIDSVQPHQQEVQDRHGRWYSLRLRPYRTLENRIEGVVVVLVDINEQKDSEQAVRESEARFELLADNAPVLFWMSDREGYRFVNRAFQEFFGESETQVRGTPVAAFVHRDERTAFENVYADAATSGTRFETRTRFRRADGEYRWLKTVGLPRILSDGQVIGFVGGMFDVTDMKDAEAALLELDRGKNEFLAMLAHELRNPLAGIMNAARLLATAQDDGVHAHAREIIDRQTLQMVRMIDDLMEVSRVTQGKIRVRPERIRLDDILRHAIESTETYRGARRQQLEVALPNAPTWIDGDPVRLEQVFVNLMQNATKFTPEKGTIWLTLNVERSDGAGAGFAVVRVRDDGAGIESSVLPRIFDLFVQGDRRAARNRSGLGIGLTLAKQLIVMHGGTIQALSDGPNHGSEFIVRLPLPSASGLRASPRAGDDAPSRRPRPQASMVRRILIVDDDADSAEGMRLLLGKQGHETEVSHDGESALEDAARFKPDVILVDIGLPDMEGYEVVSRLRERADTRGALIIAVTGYGSDADVVKSREAGFDEHMTKPVSFDVLLARMDELE